MTKVLVMESSLNDIAEAIRGKNGSANTYKPGQMAAAITALPTGITPTGTIQISENGTVDVTQYASANVSVPNSYAAGDEGKVVSNGALVSQSSGSVTQNGTVDTTLINSLTVNVSGGGGGSTVYTSTSAPTSADGSNGDIWVKYFDFEDQSTQKTYTIDIIAALRGTSALSYAGATEIDLIFDDGNNGEVSIRSLSDFTYSAQAQGGAENINRAFDNDTSTYWEANPTPLKVLMTATIPAGYTAKKLKVMQRSQNFTTDVWKDFDLKETIDGNSRMLLDVSGLSTSDWAGAYNYTSFNIPPAGRYAVVATYIKINGEWVTPAEITVTIS